MRKLKTISSLLILSIIVVIFASVIQINVYTAVADHDVEKASLPTREVQTFTGSVSQGSDSTQHTFTVPDGATLVEVEVSFSSSYDFDLSLWDDQNTKIPAKVIGERKSQLKYNFQHKPWFQ